MPWTPEAREAARQQCLERQPWKKSTGPRTPEGKRISSLNALKHGMRSRNNGVAMLAVMFEQAKAAECLKAELREWLPRAITLRQKNPDLYDALDDFANELPTNSAQTGE